MPATTFPTIHNNGTSKECLFEGYYAALKAVQAAKESLSKIEFNARDYYVQGDQAWTTARNEMVARHASLQTIASELEAICVHIQDS